MLVGNARKHESKQPHWAVNHSHSQRQRARNTVALVTWQCVEFISKFTVVYQVATNDLVFLQNWQLNHTLPATKIDKARVHYSWGCLNYLPKLCGRVGRNTYLYLLCDNKALFCYYFKEWQQWCTYKHKYTSLSNSTNWSSALIAFLFKQKWFSDFFSVHIIRNLEDTGCPITIFQSTCFH